MNEILEYMGLGIVIIIIVVYIYLKLSQSYPNQPSLSKLLY